MEKYVEAARAVQRILSSKAGTLNGADLSFCFASILAELWTAAERELGEDHADRLLRLVLSETEIRLYDEIERRKEAA